MAGLQEEVPKKLTEWVEGELGGAAGLPAVEYQVGELVAGCQVNSAAAAAVEGILGPATGVGEGIVLDGCYPPCLYEGQSEQLLLVLSGGGPWDTAGGGMAVESRSKVDQAVRVVVFEGDSRRALVDHEVDVIWEGGAGSVRLEVPACPVGVVYVAIITGSSHICVMQPLPVLPPPAAKQVQQLQQLHQQQLQQQQQVNDVTSAAPGADEEGDGAGNSGGMESMLPAAAGREQWHSFMSPLLVDLCYAIASLMPAAAAGAVTAGSTVTMHLSHTHAGPDSVEAGVVAGAAVGRGDDIKGSAASLTVMSLVRVFMAWGVNEPAAMLLQLWAQANKQQQQQQGGTSSASEGLHGL